MQTIHSSPWVNLHHKNWSGDTHSVHLHSPLSKYTGEKNKYGEPHLKRALVYWCSQFKHDPSPGGALESQRVGSGEVLHKCRSRVNIQHVCTSVRILYQRRHHPSSRSVSGSLWAPVLRETLAGWGSVDYTPEETAGALDFWPSQPFVKV